MISAEDIKNYHCPRWHELPDLDLYMDQVMSVLEKNLCIFISKDPQKAITPTMINNYVKQKMVRPPKNKKYDRGHIASFFLITLLKQMMSLGEISDAISRVLTTYTSEQGYDIFCDIFEKSLQAVFFGASTANYTEDDGSETLMIIRSVTLACSNMLYARYLLDKTRCEPENVEEEKVKDKKEKTK